MDQLSLARFAGRCPPHPGFHSFDRAATIAPAVLVMVFAAQAHAASSATNAASAICKGTGCAQRPMQVAIAETPTAVAAATPPPNALAATAPAGHFSRASQAGRTAIVMREPSTWSLLLGALALFLWRRRYGES